MNLKLLISFISILHSTRIVRMNDIYDDFVNYYLNPKTTAKKAYTKSETTEKNSYEYFETTDKNSYTNYGTTDKNDYTNFETTDKNDGTVGEEMEDNEYFNARDSSNTAEQPHICSPFTKVTIDKAFIELNRKNVITLFNNSQCYSNISYVTHKHLPVVSIENRFDFKCGISLSPLKNGKDFMDYAFNAISGTYWKNKEIIGFNNVWLGCAQEMCLNANVDTVHKTAYNVIYLFRGNHAYKWSNMSGLQKPIKIIGETSLKHPLETREYMEEGYYDASFYCEKSHKIFLIKGSTVWPAFGTNYFDRGLNVKEYFGNKFPLNVDSVLCNHNKNESKQKFFIFKDNQYFVGEDMNMNGTELTITGPMNVKNLNKHFPRKISAIFEKTNYIYIFHGWKYFKFNRNQRWFDDEIKRVEIKFEWVFNDFFKCQQNLYNENTVIGNYDKFIKDFAEYSNDYSDSEINRLETGSQDEVKDNPFLITVSIIVVIVIVIFLVCIIIIIITVIQMRNRSPVKEKARLRNEDLQGMGRIDSNLNVSLKLSEISMASTNPKSPKSPKSPESPKNVTKSRKEGKQVMKK